MAIVESDSVPTFGFPKTLHQTAYHIPAKKDHPHTKQFPGRHPRRPRCRIGELGTSEEAPGVGAAGRGAKPSRGRCGVWRARRPAVPTLAAGCLKARELPAGARRPSPPPPGRRRRCSGPAGPWRRLPDDKRPPPTASGTRCASGCRRRSTAVPMNARGHRLEGLNAHCGEPTRATAKSAPKAPRKG